MKLTKSQRVKIIQDISSHLENESWNDIDLILTQFSFPTTDEWPNSDRKSYVVGMIGKSSDDELIELGEHFGMQLTDKAPPMPETPYWKEGQLKVFISHLTSHREQAAQIQTAMYKFGMSGFVAHNDINPTLEWQIEIETALSTCDLLVALIHPGFVESKWCDQEIGFALGRGIPAFTVRCGADPHGFASRFQAFNGNGKNPSQISEELFEASIIHKKLQDKMADILIDLFINSGSFSAAKTRISYLERLKTWDPSYSARLAKAVKNNSQISGSWGVPDQVGSLIKKWKA